MNPVAAIFDSFVLYRYSLVLALSCAAGICFFMACCSHAQISSLRASAATLTAIVCSLPLCRLVCWYGRTDRFSSLFQALGSSATESYALSGVFAGCALAVFLTGGREDRTKLLDCMSVSGCAAIALGRLGSFFTETDRGQILEKLTGLPWAYPVTNASGIPEYRFATFLFQAAAAAVIGFFLAVLFFRKKGRPGNATLLFLLSYCASQVLLDSTRYDSLYLRNNGFISMVQVLSAAALIFVLVVFCVRAVKCLGFRRWMIPLWLVLAGLFGTAGYMEYYVQRHGREAAFGYSIMGLCLGCMVLLGVLLWKKSLVPEKQ